MEYFCVLNLHTLKNRFQLRPWSPHGCRRAAGASSEGLQSRVSHAFSAHPGLYYNCITGSILISESSRLGRANSMLQERGWKSNPGRARLCCTLQLPSPPFPKFLRNSLLYARLSSTRPLSSYLVCHHQHVTACQSKNVPCAVLVM